MSLYEDLTLEEVHKQLDEIKESIKDPEKAHIKEEALHIAVLSAIAEDRCEDPSGLAAEALMSRDILFPRWSA